MSDIEVAAEDDGLFFGKTLHVSNHFRFPFHAVVQTDKSALAVWRVAAEEIMRSEIGSDETPFLIMFLDP